MKKKGKVLIAAGIIFLIGALALTAYNLADALRAEHAAETLLQSIEESIESAEEQNKNQPSPSNTRSDVDAVPEMPTLDLNGSRYIGVIEIPSISVSLPVFSEWNYDLLKISPCYYSGSCYTNDLVICAHNYRSHFGQLRRAAIGTDVYFTSVNGETYHYIISNRETLRPD